MTLDEFDAKPLAKLCGTLFTAFGIGTEHSGHMAIPDGMNEPLDPYKLLDQLGTYRVFADDKRLYLTSRKLKDRTLPSGTAPTAGYCWYGKDRAIVSTHGVKDFEASLKLVSRHALHQLGHVWELHHCLDPRCAMYPPWTPSFVSGDASFCNFCREKSEAKIRLVKS
jgi:hypothetical protein